MQLVRFYRMVYDRFCGRHPKQNIMHDEWLALKDLHSDFRKIALHIKGKVLDVGCGSKPYASWFSKATQYIGIDIGENMIADCLVEENQAWPFSDSEFDSVVSFQTFEHIKNIRVVQNEIIRVHKPQGVLCLTIPFIAYEHGAPSDFRRFSKEGIKQLFPNYEIIKVIPQGRFGSTVGTLFLRWIRISMQNSKAKRLLWGLLLPAWIAFTTFINVCGWLWDKIDKTNNFYHNVLILARKCG